MRLLRCAIQYLVREKLRNLLVVAGLTTAFGAAAFMYGAAGQIAHEATRSLQWITSDADLWLVPPTGLFLDASTGAIVCDSRLPSNLATQLRAFDPRAEVRRFDVKTLNHSSLGAIVVYTIADKTETKRVACSTDLWSKAASRAFMISFDNGRLEVTSVDEALPDGVVANYVAEVNADPSWLTISTTEPALWVHRKDAPYIVRDTAKLEPVGSPGLPVLYPLKSGLGRFNTFSFDARFDALVLNGKLKSALGIFARLVLAFGALVALTSSVFGLREKGPMIAVLTAHGITGEMIGILLAESGLLTGFSWILGTTLAVFALKMAAFPAANLVPVLEGIAITAVFIPSFVLGATLISSARLLSIPPAQLVKESAF